MTFSYLVIFRLIDVTPTLSMVVLETISSHTSISSIAVIHGGWFSCCFESLHTWRMYDNNWSIRQYGSFRAVVIFQFFDWPFVFMPLSDVLNSPARLDSLSANSIASRLRYMVKLRFFSLFVRYSWTMWSRHCKVKDWLEAFIKSCYRSCFHPMYRKSWTVRMRFIIVFQEQPTVQRELAEHYGQNGLQF